MFCHKCGTEIAGEGSFCPECGAPTYQPIETPPPSLEPEQSGTEPVATECPDPVASVAPVAPIAPHVPVTPPVAPASPAPSFEPAPPVAPDSSLDPAVPADPASTQAFQPPQNPALVPSEPPETEAPKKKRKKGPLIVIIVIAALLVLGGGGFGIFALVRDGNYNKAVSAFDVATSDLGNATNRGDYETAKDSFTAILDDFQSLGTYKESEIYAGNCEDQIAIVGDNISYIDAKTLFDNKDDKAALQAFTDLGKFKDSADQAKVCQQYIDYQTATDYYNNKEWDKALEIFQKLSGQGFEDSSTWVSKTKYAKADQMVQNGDPYGAWKIFSTLVNFEDAADRASACTTPAPGTGELYHNSGYASSSVRLTFNGSGLTKPNYLKVYDANNKTLVSTVFVNPDTNTTINLPSGSYTFNSAIGNTWFGETTMFGDEGSYRTLTFDGGSTTTTLDYGYVYTLTLNVGGGDGNVGSKSVGRGDF